MGRKQKEIGLLSQLILMETLNFLVSIMEHGTGVAQYNALAKVLKDYGMCDDVKGLCFDTTASNTGRHAGTNIRFSQRQNSILLELACRRHIYDLHIKHFW